MKKIISVSLIVCMSFFCVFHFSMLFLHAGPTNPNSVKHRIAVDTYATPFFTQTWNLFAPNPVENTQNILVQYRNHAGEESEWFNISQPLLEANRSNLISGYNRAARIPSGLYFGIFSPNEIISAYQDTATEEEIEEHLNTDKLEEERTKQIDLLYRFAHSAIPLITDDEVEEIKVRIMNVEGVPYSERFNESYEQERQFIDFDWREHFYVLSYSKGGREL